RCPSLHGEVRPGCGWYGSGGVDHRFPQRVIGEDRVRSGQGIPNDRVSTTPGGWRLMASRSACRVLLIMLLSLAYARAWGGGQATPMEAAAPMRAVFETLAGAGVISGQLHAPMVMVFNHQ